MNEQEGSVSPRAEAAFSAAAWLPWERRQRFRTIQPLPKISLRHKSSSLEHVLCMCEAPGFHSQPIPQPPKDGIQNNCRYMELEQENKTKPSSFAQAGQMAQQVRALPAGGKDPSVQHLFHRTVSSGLPQALHSHA